MDTTSGNNEKHEVSINMREMRMRGLECDRNSVIHYKQMKEVCDIIKERMEYGKYDPDENMKSQNDVISIFARRGAGKTTFVKTLYKMLSECTDDHYNGIKCGDLMCIDVIEPNQVYKKENFMIRFLASIHSEFKRRIESKNDNQQRENNLREFKKISDRLFEALPVIDGVGKLSLYSDWEDSDYVAEKFLELAMNAKDLEKRFHQYIHKSLSLVNKKMLLFILDDCDVNIEKTFEILETIRLYFTSPQIIVIMTGDASLYGMTIRRNYWNFFDKEFLDKECVPTKAEFRKRTEFRKMVNRLETQYLQKMIKAEHRIVLNNLFEKYRESEFSKNDQNPKYPYKVKILFSNGKEMELKEVYKEILKELDLVRNCESDCNIFMDHLLKQPFRNQYRLLSVYDDYLAKESGRDKQYEKTQLTDKVLKVFEVYINQCSADSKHLMGKSPIYSGWLMKFLIDNNIVGMGGHMLPNMEDDSLNNALLALCASCARQMQTDKSIVFDFLIRISFVRQALLALGEDGKKLDEFARICYDAGATKLLGSIHAYVNSGMNVIPSLRPNDTAQNSMAGVCILSEPVVGDIECLEVKLIKLIQVVSIASDMSETYMCSFYRVVSCIAELLRNCIEKGWNTELMRMQLEQLAQIHTYIEPNAQKPPRGWKKTNNNETLKDIQQNTDAESQFFIALESWGKGLKEQWITPYSLDRLCSRMYYTFKDVDLNQGTDSQNLGVRFSNYVIAFWNACIVEECIINNKMDGIQFGHEKEIVRIFISNYRRISNYPRISKGNGDDDFWKNSFAKAMTECPLLRCYVDPTILAMMNHRELGWKAYESSKLEIKSAGDKEMIETLNREIKNRDDLIANTEKELNFCYDLQNLESQIEAIKQELVKGIRTYDERMALIRDLKGLQKEKQKVASDVMHDEKKLYSILRDLRVERKVLAERLREYEGSRSKSNLRFVPFSSTTSSVNKVSVFKILTQIRV